MRNNTRLLYTALLAHIAQLNGVQADQVDKKFSVDPSIQQTLETRMQESSDFLSRINVIGVPEIKGDKIGLGVGSPIASRTNVANGPRTPRDVSALDEHGYECQFTEFDTFLGYSKLDAWAKFPDFQTRVRDAIVQRQALDRIAIGWNGTSAAAATNQATNPLLQDVNIGWLQQYRTNAAQRVMDDGKVAGKVQIGTGGDYANIDALVYDAIASLLDPWHQNRTDLIVLMGRGLLHDKYFPLINKDQDAQNTLATDIIVSQKRVGGLPAAQVPYFPDGKLMVTTFDNLSLYWQEGARRRFVKEEPERNRVTNYESSNDAYVVEDYGLGCVVENIQPVAEA